MKKTVSVFIAAFLLMIGTASAQQKLGHINSLDVLQAMPEFKQMSADIQKQKDSYTKALESMYGDYERKQKELQALSQDKNTPDAIIESKIQELQDLQKRIQDFETKVNEDLQKMQNDKLKPINEKYLKGKIPTWNRFVQHPDYDSFWQKNSPLSYMSFPQVPLLHVGGYFDQEDIMGPQLMYAHLEKKDSNNRNAIVLGPWNHGQWARPVADSLGKIAFGSNTAAWFQALQKKWFDYWLKGKGDGQFAEAYAFQTGTNTWQEFESWPPKKSTQRKLFAHSDGTASFDSPTSGEGMVSFISDPAKPVPYRTLPIEATYGPGSRWRSWQVEDQRFVYTRPDVVSFTSATLTENLAVTGNITAHLQASTSGADADWVVKLIDVYPPERSTPAPATPAPAGRDVGPPTLTLAGYQQLVRGEPLRGKYRRSFERPEPFVPGQVEPVNFTMPDVNHTFRRGHRIMVHVQSTWFPLVDRNPQTFVNIPTAKATDFRAATQRVMRSQAQPSGLEVHVLPPVTAKAPVRR